MLYVFQTVSSLSSAQKSVSESIWAAQSHELWGCKIEYAAQILSLTVFRVKERLLAVYMSFSVWIEGTIYTTSNHELSFKVSGWPCHGINSGENNVQAWQTVQLLSFGAREHLFIYSSIIKYTFVILCGCQSIWDLKFEEYWEECDQLNDTHVIVHNTLILICLLLDAFLDIASFKPWHEWWFSHTQFYFSRMSLSMQPMQMHAWID